MAASLFDFASFYRRYWAGGGIEAAAADSSFAVPRSLGPAGAASNPHEIFEDGTPHFMGISSQIFICVSNSYLLIVDFII